MQVFSEFVILEYRHLSRLSLFASAIFAVFATAAQAVTYECEITRKNHGYVPEILFIVHKGSAKSATVLDPIIDYFNDGKPVSGTVSANNDKRLTVKWKLKDLTTPGGQFVAGFNYTATYLKKTGKLSVSAKPLGYLDNMRGFGTCKLKK